MTALAVPSPVAQTLPSPSRTPLILFTGLLGGVALGITARAWMRLITEDPEFTWSGTIFIVTAFTIFGFTQSIAAVARRRTRRRWAVTVVRLIGAVGFLPLFVGAGALMLPTVVGGGLALTRVDWGPVRRVIWGVIATAPVVFVGTQLVGSFGWSGHALVGFIAMLAIYGTIVAATRFTLAPQADGWQLDRRVRIVIFVILVLVFAVAMIGVVSS